MWKEPFLLATQIKLLIVSFCFTRCLHRQVLLFLSKPGFPHQNVALHHKSAALPWVLRYDQVKEGNTKFPCLKWLWSLWTVWIWMLRVKRKRDPKCKQSKTKHMKIKEGVESLLVAFVFCFCKIRSSYLYDERERSQARRKDELSLQFWLLVLTPFTTWVPSHSRELRNVSEYWKAPCRDWMCSW